MRGGSSSGTTLVVAEKTSRLLVDHRLPLRIYFRAADSILRQARIYRKENNLIDLYVLLLRFSSLVMETIPQHRDYRLYLGREKIDFRKRLLDVLNELETLKPVVQKEVSRYNNSYLPAAPASNLLLPTNAIVPGPVFARSESFAGFGPGKDHSQAGYNWATVNSMPYRSNANSNKQEQYQVGPEMLNNSSSWPADLMQQECPQGDHKWSQDSRIPAYSQVGNNLNGNLTSRPVYSAPLSLPYSSPASASLEDRMSKLSFRLPTPASETLSRHSFMGSTAKRTTVSKVLTSKVQYPSLIDESPVVIPSLGQNWQSLAPTAIPPMALPQKAVAEPVLYNDADMIKFEEKQSGLVDAAVALHSQLSRQPSPPPVEAEVISIPSLPHSKDTDCTENLLGDVLLPPAEPSKLSEDSVQSRKPKRLHISVRLMDDFLGIARGNIKDNLETCGVLAGSLKEGIFYVTTLIVPKQEATANSCSTTDEEEIFEYQDKHDLFQFGWIHTHPSQSCFMSSIDVHTHYSYQVMLPEAVAIVMAPTDPSRKYGIFRLVEPGGIKVIQSCERRGFHAHNEPEGGGPLYESCGHVLLDSKLGCDVVDLR